ncbi:MAG: aminoglycoside 6-adenylyltransferase [Chloroflexi bacterium]|nr:aminoglycoside 6-adenylyltransferase [Chloroflexota bacterium]
MDIRHPLFEKVIDWADGEAAICAVVVTGSLARGDGSIDEYSDLDVQIITRDIKAYSADDSWLDALGEVWIRFPLNEDLPYRLVWFAGGYKVDFQFIAVDQVRAELDSGAMSDEYQRGYIVVLDKDGLYRDLPPSPRTFPSPPSPSADEVLATINEFWFEAIHVAQFIRRREFWVVKWRDWTMKEDLLRLLEWHARATGDDVNTWLLGKRILDWADDEAFHAIKEIWTGWDAAESWRGLLTQLALFRRLSVELCAALGIDYSDATHREIEGYIHRLYKEDQEAH